MADPAIGAHGLVKRFGPVVALDGIDLAAQAGRVLGLLGPNGAGKTTAVRILTTILAPDASAGSNFIGTLPAVARPQHDLYLTVEGGDSSESLHISPNGNMWAFGFNQPNQISLANISYQTSS